MTTPSRTCRFSIAMATLLCTSIASAAQWPQPEPAAPRAAGLALAAPKLWPVGKVLSRQSAMEQRIRAALDRPATFDLPKTTWAAFTEKIRSTHGIPVRLHIAALTADDKAADDFTFDAVDRDVPLRTALRSILHPHDLTFVVENDALVLTTRTAAESEQILRVYQVHDLVLMPADATGAFPKFEPLIRQITWACSRETWRQEGGTQGEIKEWEGPGSLALVVVQSEIVHEQIEEFLRQLRAARSEPVAGLQAAVAPLGESPPAPPPPPLPRGKIIRPESNTPSAALAQALATPTSFDEPEITLGKFTDLIGKRHGITLTLDLTALTADGKAPDTIVHAKFDDCRLSAVLDTVLSQQGLTFLIRDGRLEITTKTAAESYMPTYMYEAHDLLPRITDLGSEYSLDALEELITSVAAPETWGEGGPAPEIGTLRTPGSVVLRVTQMQRTHAQIELLLDLLREAHVPELYEARRLRPWQPGPVPARQGGGPGGGGGFY